MNRAFEAGDVAMVECSDGEWRRAVCDGNLHGLVWRFPDATYRLVRESSARPLVLIDPEDDEAVERLDALLHRMIVQRSGSTHTIGDLAAALREFADPKPPKPDEPTGLGAVVRDAEGRIYTRYETDGPKHEPQPWWQSANGPEHDVVRRFAWEDIDAVEVLSEGVTP